MDLSIYDTMKALEEEARRCTSCVLSESRSQVVFSSGRLDAELIVVGEAPGASEDRDGTPFVGRSGVLLRRLILEVLGLDSGQYYVTNVVKCRPEGNRKPLAVEIGTCSHFLERQLEILKGGVILAVGEVAARTLTQQKISVGSMRGSVYTHGDKKVIVTYHPAYALRGGRAIEDSMRVDLGFVGGLLSER
ncbi:MAG: uracil-DNA glycosylase [Actinomycetota bacterium]|nr:uracil-DNA glycosylase [Actinomycetota bacterium]